MSNRTNEHLSTNDLDRLRVALLRERDALLASQREREPEARGGADGEIEDGDVAERMVVQEDALRLSGVHPDRLADVERAIAKLDAGTYGVSEESGEPIPLERLDVVPWARRTAAEEERRERTGD
jgi:DnaK suppressor protein